MSDPKKFPFQPGEKKTTDQPEDPTDYHDMNTVNLKPASSGQDETRQKIFNDDTRIPGARKSDSSDDDTKKIRRKGLRESSPNITPMPEDDEDPEGTFRIGPYIVYREMAKGGMGAVYDATDPALNRRVAIKIMDDSLIHDKDAVKRFQREARATASIDHVNIARIYMVGMTESMAPFIAMEFIDGGTIERVISNRDKFSLSKIAEFMIQSCQGLEAAKKKSIIHRDIKPANIMVSKEGKIKLVDFGLAKFFHEESFRTVAGMVMGTPRYMSPEQAQGRSVDHRADIYSLGATLYHILCGKTPFDGDNPTQIMMKQVTSPLASMRSINPDIPMEFEDLTRKCLAKDPNDRYQDYDDIIADLSKLKLQFRSREEGSYLGDRSLSPAAGNDTRGNPLPPEHTYQQSQSGDRHRSGVQSRSSASTAGVQMFDQTENDEQVPLWRWLAIGGAGFVVLIIILTAVISSMDGEDETDSQAENSSPSKKTGLQVLLEAIIDAKEGGDNSTNRPRINPDYVAMLATEEIIYDLQEGLVDYRNRAGNFPGKLRDLVREDVIFQNFDTSSDGTPRDGWNTPFEYLGASQTLISAGLDEIHFTEDDIVLEMNDVITIRDEEGEQAYDRLRDAENKRQEQLSE